jgi:hypothetical protein
MLNCLAKIEQKNDTSKSEEEKMLAQIQSNAG